MSRPNRRLKLCLVVVLLCSAGSALAWDRVYRGSVRPAGAEGNPDRLVTFRHGGVTPRPRGAPPPKARPPARPKPRTEVPRRRERRAARRPEPRTWTVRKGESLSRIAGEVYGDPNRWPRILKANDLDDPDLIREGQVLRIP